jgi:hypothetical protein
MVRGVLDRGWQRSKTQASEQGRELCLCPGDGTACLRNYQRIRVRAAGSRGLLGPIDGQDDIWKGST